MKHIEFKAVFFDLDGTLLYTLPDIAAAVNHALGTKGLPPRPVEEYKYKVGWGLEETVRRALPEELQSTAAESGMLQELTAELIKEYRRNPYELTTPYAGIPELLDSLQQRNITMSILSNKEHLLTTTIVKELLSPVEFLTVQGVSANIPPKPDPRGVELLLGNTGIPPSEVLYVGDSGVDMDTAVRAGLYPVGVAWGYRPVEELLERGAEVVLHEPKELMGLFPELLLDRM